MTADSPRVASGGTPASGLAGRPRAIDILGVPIDDVTYDETLALIEQWIAAGAEGGPHVITTPNPEFVMLARRTPSFRALLRRAALNVPDGVGLLLAARMRRDAFREHVRGTDLVHRLAALGAAMPRVSTSHCRACLAAAAICSAATPVPPT